ncbi:uncharacterized protein LOC111149839 isoform X1 [Enhydra lutris kenyoni]|uniref:Uncharacterized protein LOC111149839 isoform X1 n=1 Tax=Enhydra lutris kenyoni TaxID=391180 RepID=A0A2Y9JP14_ENHLU|nr:uncharacterized protein LOC111149839 isoform X1 [Enhydra lutris kenyoni]
MFLLREPPRQGSRHLPDPYGPHSSCPDPDPPILLGTYSGTGCTAVFPVKQPAAFALLTPNTSPHRSHTKGRPVMAQKPVFSMGGSSRKGDLLSHWPTSNTPVTASPATETLGGLHTKSPDSPRAHPALRPPHRPLSLCCGLLLAAGHLLWASPFTPAHGGGLPALPNPARPQKVPDSRLSMGAARSPHFTRPQHASVATTGPQSSDLSSPMCITRVCKCTRRHQATHGAGLHVPRLRGLPAPRPPSGARLPTKSFKNDTSCPGLERRQTRLSQVPLISLRGTRTADGCAQQGRHGPRSGPFTETLCSPTCGIFEDKSISCLFLS